MPDGAISVAEIQKIPAFQHMPLQQLQSLAGAMVRRTYSPGQLIFLEGETSIGVWFVLDGHVRIIKNSQTGRLQGLCLVNRGKCFGSCPLFDATANPADAQALDEVTLAVLLQDDLQHMVYHDPHLATSLLEIYNKRVELLAQLGECLGSWPIAARINDCLVAHAEQIQPHPVVRLTHEQVATLVGTAREVVTRHLSKLENENVVKTDPGHITLLDINALRYSLER